jgi:hypothetical protein
MGKGRLSDDRDLTCLDRIYHHQTCLLAKHLARAPSSGTPRKKPLFQACDETEQVSGGRGEKSNQRGKGYEEDNKHELRGDRAGGGELGGEDLKIP